MRFLQNNQPRICPAGHNRTLLIQVGIGLACECDALGVLFDKRRVRCAEMIVRHRRDKLAPDKFNLR